jgi:hypothetical protein
VIPRHHRRHRDLGGSSERAENARKPGLPADNFYAGFKVALPALVAGITVNVMVFLTMLRKSHAAARE